MRALIVDDDESYLHLLRMLLTRQGHTVYEATDGLKAWNLLQIDPIPFVITDWMLPGLDGVELIRRIRTANFPNYTYLILLTAKKGSEDIVRGLEAGADDYLTKPFDISELRARIGIGERILDLEQRLRESLQQLASLASHDSLTGLLNRRALYEIIEKERVRTQNAGVPLSVVMIDLDHFKLINDQYGHVAGDMLLIEVASRLKSCMREMDTVARFGGDEFIITRKQAELILNDHSERRMQGAFRQRYRSDQVFVFFGNDII